LAGRLAPLHVETNRTGVGELDAVAHQIEEYLAQPQLVADHPGGQIRGDLHGQGESFVRGRRAQGGHHPVEQAMQR
jgi:hypothetical protein